MEIAVLYRGERVQIILTPETDHEKAIIRLFSQDTKDVRMQRGKGSFYRTQGGWDRQGEDESLMIYLDAP